MVADDNLLQATSLPAISPVQPVCPNCMFLKIECDRVKPICEPCPNHPKYSACEYQHGSACSRSKALEDTVQRLEARLHELEHPEDTVKRLEARVHELEHPEDTVQRLQTRLHELGYDAHALHSPPSPPGLPHRPQNASTPYRGVSPSSLGGFSEAGSEGPYESRSSSSPGEWNFSGYNWPILGQVLQELNLTGSVTKLDKYPVDSGSAADIYGGILGASKVAIKVYRRMNSEPQQLEQKSRVCLACF
ncbi:hypothetical protein B0H14DRAFT_474956 [Mycena olivaceomarginata]|nr:hypothetical protein B0H14DRAFT_474956 [Mycena olivaceomarginata]